MIPLLTDRISLLQLANTRFPNGVGVEIGVAGGHFTKQLVVSLENLGTLHCIDPWKHFAEGYDDSCNLSQYEQDGRFEQFFKDMGLHPKIRIHRLMSHEACNPFKDDLLFGDEEVDFIYLDANHSFASVMQDLTCWWPILKPGGIFAGHDYYDGNAKGHGVKLAVDAFARERGIEVHRTTSEFCRKEGVYGAGWEGFSFILEKAYV